MMILIGVMIIKYNIQTDTYSNVFCRYYIGEMVVQALPAAGTNTTFAV